MNLGNWKKVVCASALNTRRSKHLNSLYHHISTDYIDANFIYVYSNDKDAFLCVYFYFFLSDNNIVIDKMVKNYLKVAKSRLAEYCHHCT